MPRGGPHALMRGPDHGCGLLPGQDLDSGEKKLGPDSGPGSRTTRNGDTLSGLAGSFCKDPQESPLIWKAKLKVIGTNGNVVEDKQKLDIPFLWQLSRAAVEEARRTAAAARPGLDWR
jgi:hypothetical protein